jgi:hypothetical protein
MVAKADLPEFTDQQLRDALQRVGTEARHASFDAGQPIVFLKDNVLIALYRDGREVVLKSVQNGIDAVGDAR